MNNGLLFENSEQVFSFIDWFKNLVKKDKMKISRKKAIKLINENKGKFFTVTFTKNNGELRTINAVRKSGIGSPLGYLTVYSIKDKDYRNIDTRTISNLKLGGESYKVK